MRKAIEELDAEIRACRRCADNLANHPANPPRRPDKVQPRPILSTPFSASIMLIGQAPGLTEYESGLPFQGPAGTGVRAFFASCGVQVNEFDRVVYQTSVVKCYPGRKEDRGRWLDRSPDGMMKRSCSGFLRSQIEVVNPHVIVCMGGSAAEALDKLRGLRGRRTLGKLVGKVEEWGDRYIVFLGHTSPASRFLNEEENRHLQEQGRRLLTNAVKLLRESGHLISASHA